VTVRRMRDLTPSQRLLLTEAVSSGGVSPYHQTQRRPLRTLVGHGLLRRLPPFKGDKYLLIPEYVPTARGRALVAWCDRWRQKVRPFKNPGTGGRVVPYRRL